MSEPPPLTDRELRSLRKLLAGIHAEEEREETLRSAREARERGEEVPLLPQEALTHDNLPQYRRDRSRLMGELVLLPSPPGKGNDSPEEKLHD